MDHIPYTTARAQLAELLDKAVEDREAITITRQGKESVVMIADSEYQSLLETAYLLRSPKNVERLLQAITDARNGENLHDISLHDLRKKLTSQ